MGVTGPPAELGPLAELPALEGATPWLESGPTPPVPPATAAGAPATKIVMLPRNVLRARARKTATSFVGLRG